MDSFYDAPRKPPTNRNPPVPFPTPATILPTHVPDVSMLEQNHGTVPVNKNVEMSYNAWKIRNKFGKENVHKVAAPPQSQASILRKQVRFQSPQAPFNPLLPMNNRTQPQVKENTFQAPIYNAPRSTNNILPAKPFQKVYLSNIPNRNLDLSIIESSRVEPATSNGFQRRYHMAESTTIEPKVEPQPKKESDEPTVKDLMKIIQQQNEQLMCLQQQVSTLLQERNEKPAVAQAPQPIQLKAIDSKKGVLPKFAFDVMTSFEVSLRPPPTNKNGYQGPKIQEIFEPVKVSNQPSRTTDLSLTLNEPIVVQEECHSPEQSIHVEMQDFSSESEEEDNAPNKNSLIGWTIYNNVMDQVNHLLKNSPDLPEQKHNQPMGGGNTMKQVKQATLRHLKSVGVNLPNSVPIDDSNESSSHCSPNEISIAVKQLLMKYLPDEQLAKINCKQAPSRTKPNYPTNLINRRPEFSMATVQYMEKYNLLNKGKQSNKNQDNFLDITALKQQPKLL